MGKYEYLKSIIIKYLEREDVVNNFDEVVSLYSLVNMVEEKFSKLEKALNTEELLYRINSLYTFKNIFKLNKTEFRSIVPEIQPKDEDGKQRITMTFVLKQDHKIKKINIFRNIGDRTIYYGKSNTKFEDKIFKDCYNSIQSIFDRIEPFAPLFKEEPEIVSQDIENEDFDITLNFNSLGIFFFRFRFNKETDPDNIQDIKWINEEDIPSILKSTKKLILRKIPVDVSSLNPVCRQIVDENRPKAYKKRKR